ncbi:MAG: cytochrome c family protein [Pseudomonadota bacterium]
MDSFEWNKIIGAVLGTAVFIFVVRMVAEHVYEPEHPAKPGYVVEGVIEEHPAGGAAATPVAEVAPDWGTVLATADVAAGQASTAKCATCHDFTKGGPNKIGPGLFGVVENARATHPGYAYSAAMKGKPGNWTYDELNLFLKSPAMDIPGTKMSFAGIRSEKERINLIAYLRSNDDSQAPIPAPKPAEAAAAPAAPAAGEAAPAGVSPKGGAPVPAPAH